MGDPQTSEWQEFLNQTAEFLMKFLGFIVSITLAVAVRIAVEVKKKVLSLKEIWAIVLTSLFVGYLVATWFVSKGWIESGKIVVPLATLIGQNLVNHLILNWKSILEKLFNIFIKNGNGNGHKKSDDKDSSL